jgi:hypothetical protein
MFDSNYYFWVILSPLNFRQADVLAWWTCLCSESATFETFCSLAEVMRMPFQSYLEAMFWLRCEVEARCADMVLQPKCSQARHARTVRKVTENIVKPGQNHTRYNDIRALNDTIIGPVRFWL